MKPISIYIQFHTYLVLMYWCLLNVQSQIFHANQDENKLSKNLFGIQSFLFYSKFMLKLKQLSGCKVNVYIFCWDTIPGKRKDIILWVVVKTSKTAKNVEKSTFDLEVSFVCIPRWIRDSIPAYMICTSRFFFFVAFNISNCFKDQLFCTTAD